MKFKTALFIFITVIAFLFNCGKSDKTYTIEIKDGVNYVHNKAPLWGDEQRISLELVRQIGELDTDDENLQFYRLRDIAFDDEDNMYILDAGNYRVQKFDKEGNYILSFGRQGQGPGDLRSARQLQFDSDGLLHVLDLGNNCVQVFTTDGKFFRMYSAKGFANGFTLLNSGLIAGNGYLGGLQTRDRRVNLQDVEFPNLYIYDQKATIVRKIGKERKYEARDMKALGNYSSVTFDDQDNLYLAFDNRNLIEKYTSNGKPLLKISREKGYREITNPERIREEIAGGIMADFSIINKFSGGIQLDSKGRMWVLSYIRQLSADERKMNGKKDASDLVNFEVYDKEGILLTRIPIEFGISREFKRIYNDCIYFMDSRQEMAVYEYKIVEQ